MLPSATELRYLLEITKTSNLSRAAVRLGVTQPALTHAMQRLEEHVGVKILVRTRTGVRLTRAGERVTGRAAQLLEAWELVETAAREDETQIKGRYRIGCHPSVGCYLLPTFFRDLDAAAPGIEVQLAHDLSRRVTEAVIDFRVDVGFVVNPIRHPDLVLKKLGTDVVTVFEAKRGRYGEDLFGDPDLFQTQHVLKKMSAHTPKVRRFVECPNLEVVRELVASGAGFGILPSRVARGSGTPRLRSLGDRMPNFQDVIYLIYRPEILASGAGRELVRIASGALAAAP